MIRLYGEYLEPPGLVRAIEELRARGPVRLEAYLPYPVPEVERALAAPPSKLPIFVLAAGLGGAGGAYFLQWLLNAYLYPLNAGARPPHFPLSFVPITFEMGVLFASFTAVIAVMIGARMLRLWHPSSEADIESSSGTRFWLEVEIPDARVEADIAHVLSDTGANLVRRVEVAS